MSSVLVKSIHVHTYLHSNIWRKTERVFSFSSQLTLQVLEMNGNTGHSWFHLMTSVGTGLKASESKSVDRGYGWDNNESSRHSALYCGERSCFLFIIWERERQSVTVEEKRGVHELTVSQWDTRVSFLRGDSWFCVCHLYVFVLTSSCQTQTIKNIFSQWMEVVILQLLLCVVMFP